MQCRKCGVEINTKIREADGSVVCPGCGTVYRPKSAPKPEQRPTVAPATEPRPARTDNTHRNSSQPRKAAKRFVSWSKIAIAAVIVLVLITGAFIALSQVKKIPFVATHKDFENGATGSYRYNAEGQLITEIISDNNGTDIAQYNYDILGRVSQIRYYEDYIDSARISFSEEYFYDDDSDRISEVKQYSNYGIQTHYSVFEYNSQGQIVKQEHYSLSDGIEWIREYTYDSKGNYEKEVYYDRIDIHSPFYVQEYKNTYDFFGNLKKVEVWSKDSIISHLIGYKSYQADFVTLKSYLKGSSPKINITESYSQNNVLWSEANVDIIFAGLEVDSNYLNTGDNFVELAFTVTNRNNYDVIITIDNPSLSYAGSSNSLNSKNHLVEAGTTQTVSIFKRNELLPGVSIQADKIERFSLELKCWSDFTRGNNTTSWNTAGKSIILDIDATVNK